jgi:broad specificity phosphatase PhoE
MKVIFVRHGESEANVADFINDDPQRSVNLTELGRQQAGRAAELLKDVAFTHAFASEFPRAQQTAAIILRHYRCELQVDARLNERKSGMDGLPTSTFNDMVLPDPIHVRPPLGENFLEQTERLRSFLQSLESLPKDAMILAASHEYPLRSILMIAGADAEGAVRQAIPNCGMVTVALSDGRWLRVPQLEE